MTSLVDPGRLIRPAGTSRALIGPCTPRRGGMGHRVSPWDTMGYHGITWASMNCRARPHAPAHMIFNALLGGCSLKEWLSGLGILVNHCRPDHSREPTPQPRGL